MPVMVITLLTLVFIILRVLPGDPVSVILGPKAPPEVVEELRKALGLDKPLHIQYIDYLGKILHGDFGLSYYWKIPVRDLLWPRFLATLELSLLAMVIAIALGVTLGALGALKRNTVIDVVTRLIGVASYAVPVFLLGLMMQLILGVYLGLFPISGRISSEYIGQFRPITGLYLIDTLIQGRLDIFVDVLKHLVMPATALGFIISGVINRMTRQSLLEVLDKEFIIAARARGIPEDRILTKYALRNALIPILTIAGMQFALLLAGAVLTESTFSYPGLGTFLVTSVTYRDYNAIQGAIVLYAIVVVIVNTITDILYAFIDPRVRY